MQRGLMPAVDCANGTGRQQRDQHACARGGIIESANVKGSHAASGDARDAGGIGGNALNKRGRVVIIDCPVHILVPVVHARALLHFAEATM